MKHFRIVSSLAVIASSVSALGCTGLSPAVANEETRSRTYRFTCEALVRNVPATAESAFLRLTDG